MLCFHDQLIMYTLYFGAEMETTWNVERRSQIYAKPGTALGPFAEMRQIDTLRTRRQPRVTDSRFDEMITNVAPGEIRDSIQPLKGPTDVVLDLCRSS